ncbi:HET-domain-containing protein [Lentinus brumalis]|uniref:HET-domain-containing protein n=1 Tax=Lentinus brumalis TaxID=2498619 RepID=A0A371CWM5_9APHY|nr:HET-domain-containing protein [Polyporus brumalis]
MWLLHTSSGELRCFNSNERVRYAILSHVWDNNEQTFQQVQALQHSGGLAQASDKIRNFCEFARKRGYEWVWVDTCCIDKMSSAELSEAINSMFQWYQSASECVAFLADVPETEDLASPKSAFRRSRWFTRGWTLQELIAPREVLFVGEHWHILGSKHSMTSLVDSITAIGTDVLTHAAFVDEVSVAARMSWASKRHTTRVEDEAYSLMGLFGIYMPTEEILRTIPDDSIRKVLGRMLRLFRH